MIVLALLLVTATAVATGQLLATSVPAGAYDDD